MSDAPAAPARGILEDLLDLYFSPRDGFASVLRAPRLAFAISGYMALGLLFTGVWMHKMEPREFFRNQMEESGQWDKMNAEQRPAVLDAQARVFPVLGWVFGILGQVVFLLGTSGALLFVYRFFYASEVDFRQSLGIVAWTFLAVGLIATPLILLVMHLKGDWNVNPGEVLQANPTLLLEKGETAKALWALLGSLDLFPLWQVFLLASGFGVASQRTTGSALWGVGACWFLLVLGKVGLALLR